MIRKAAWTMAAVIACLGFPPAGSDQTAAADDGPNLEARLSRLEAQIHQLNGSTAQAEQILSDLAETYLNLHGVVADQARTRTADSSIVGISSQPPNWRSELREAICEWADQQGYDGYKLVRLSNNGAGLGRMLKRAAAAGAYGSLYVSTDGSRQIHVRVWIDDHSRGIYYLVE
jgi:hypothetical protein